MTPPHSFQSIVGGIGYPPSHPSRYAGFEGSGMARLKVEQDCIVISPLWPWRQLMRMPVLRIPLSAVESASRIVWGVKLNVPSEPALDGTRFRRWYGGGQRLEELIEFMQSRGITIQTMPPSQRVRGFGRDFAVSQRPGWIWRDRGWIGFLESAVGLSIGLTILLLGGFFSNAPAWMLVWVAFLVAVIVWGWFAGYRRRKKLPR